MIITCGTLLMEILLSNKAATWLILEVHLMQNAIHPEYNEITATCSCSNVIKVGSTAGKNLTLDICGACHPFYTGTQRVVDTGGRIDKFKKRFGSLGSK